MFVKGIKGILTIDLLDELFIYNNARMLLILSKIPSQITF
jgi:hypothetical protein